MVCKSKDCFEGSRREAIGNVECILLTYHESYFSLRHNTYYLGLRALGNKDALYVVLNIFRLPPSSEKAWYLLATVVAGHLIPFVDFNCV